MASNLENADKQTYEGAYIPLKAFKDRFYPGRPWPPHYEDSVSKNLRIGRADLDSVSSASVAISTVMQGKTNADLADELEM